MIEYTQPTVSLYPGYQHLEKWANSTKISLVLRSILFPSH